MIGRSSKPVAVGRTINTSVPPGGIENLDGDARQLVRSFVGPNAAGPPVAVPVVPEGPQMIVPVGTVGPVGPVGTVGVGKGVMMLGSM